MVRRCSRPRCYAILLTVVAVLVGPKAHGASDPCDPNLLQRGDAHGYRLRGERCEGLFDQPVAGGGLVVVSFTASVEPFDPKIDREVELGWEAPDGGEVHIRAHSLPRLLYYRMDALRPAVEGRYKWPTDMLAVVKVTSQDLGLVAYTMARGGSDERPVYLPLRVGWTQAGGAPVRYELLLRSSRELSEVFNSLRRLEDQAGSGRVSWEDRSLGRRVYWADEPVRIQVEMPANAARGLYQLDVGATLNGGGSATAQVVFWHGGP